MEISCLEGMYHSFMSQQFDVKVLCFDGVMILQKDEQLITDENIKICERLPYTIHMGIVFN